MRTQAAVIGGYRADTLAYKSRVEADGGIVVDIDYVDSIFTLIASQGIYTSGRVWCSPNAGIKKNVSDQVSKIYNLFGSLDAVQATTGSMPIHYTGGSLWSKKAWFGGVSKGITIPNLILPTYVDVLFYFDRSSGHWDSYHGRATSTDDGFQLYNGGKFTMCRGGSEHVSNYYTWNEGDFCNKTLISAKYNATLGKPSIWVNGAFYAPVSNTGTIRENTLTTRDLKLWTTSNCPEAATDYVIFDSLPDANFNAIYNFVTNTYAGTRIICDGDGNVSGFGLSSNMYAFPETLRTLIKNDPAFTKGVSVYNKGGAGNSLVAQVSQLATTVNPLCRAGNIYVTFNYRIPYAGMTKEQVYASTKDLVLTQTALGFKVVVLTAINHNATYKPAYSTEYPWINTQIKTDLATYPNVYVCDIGDRAEFQDYNNTTYYQANGLDLTSTGHALIASSLKPVIQSII